MDLRNYRNGLKEESKSQKPAESVPMKRNREILSADYRLKLGIRIKLFSIYPCFNLVRIFEAVHLASRRWRLIGNHESEDSQGVTLRTVDCEIKRFSACRQ